MHKFIVAAIDRGAVSVRDDRRSADELDRVGSGGGSAALILRENVT
ncbi:hypothetical protein ACFWYW_39825 [Nonomuraea sp. NPDC059023]